MLRIIVSIAVIGIASTQLASAQTETAQEKLDRLLACQSIERDAARLDCFDGRAATAASTPTQAAAIPVIPAPVTTPAPTRERVVAAAPTPAPASEPTSEARAEEREEREARLPFWARLQGNSREEEKREPKEITVTITNVVESSSGRLYFQSEDGLVWRQIEVERFNVPRDLPAQATIKRASFGTQWLSFERRGATRVKRVNAD